MCFRNDFPFYIELSTAGLGKRKYPIARSNCTYLTGPFFTMHPCILCLALSLIARASDDDYPLATTTNLFFNDDDDSSDYIPLDELSTLPLPDSSYLLANEPSSSLFDFEDTSLSDFILSSDEDENDLSTCLLPPGSSSPAAAASRRTRARRGANSCSNNAVEGGPLFAVDAPPGRTAGAGTSTQRKTMEEVKTYWCAETSFPNFDNIPVCDAIFDSDALYQAPVHLSLDGAVPNQGFFNIMKGWPRECSAHFVFGWQKSLFGD